jgi:Cys-tRNA(Pro)/Cys-tRNA(Cys) deacylase
VSGRETPATLAADHARIHYVVHQYAHQSKNSNYGLEAADALGVDPARVFKTLVAQVDTRPVIAVVPVNGQLDLKKLAAIAGGCKAIWAARGAAAPSTGYVLGGISPLGQRRRLPTFIDDSASSFDTVYVSAGRRGLEIELTLADLASLTAATLAPISRDN